MNVYFIYSADTYDRSVGTVLLNEKSLSDMEFEKLVRIAKTHTDGDESSIIDYLIKRNRFIIANTPKCNIESI